MPERCLPTNSYSPNCGAARPMPNGFGSTCGSSDKRLKMMWGDLSTFTPRQESATGCALPIVRMSAQPRTVNVQHRPHHWRFERYRLRYRDAVSISALECHRLDAIAGKRDRAKRPGE